MIRTTYEQQRNTIKMKSTTTNYFQHIIKSKHTKIEKKFTSKPKF